MNALMKYLKIFKNKMLKTFLITILIIQFLGVAFAEIINVTPSMPKGTPSPLSWPNLQESAPEVTPEVTNDTENSNIEISINTEVPLYGNLYIEVYYNEEAEEILLSRRLKF